MTIPKSVTTIGSNSFDGSSLNEVHYPGSKYQWSLISVGADNTTLLGATYIYDQFDIIFDTDGGSKVEPITLAPDETVPALANPTKAHFTFQGWNPVLPATMPAMDLTVKAIWSTAPDFGTPDFKLPAAIRQIGEEAFAGVSSMTVVEVPNGCESIGKWAFQNCTGLTRIRIPASVTAIDDLAFDGCANVLVYGTSPSAAKTFCDAHTNCKFVVENTNE